MAGKYIRNIPQYAKDPADDPEFRLEDIAEISTVRMDGREYPMIRPIDRWESFMDFDRNVVKSGTDEFIRPFMESEILPPGKTAEYILVVGDEHSRIRLPAKPET
jgi:hypothetical protein